MPAARRSSFSPGSTPPIDLPPPTLCFDVGGTRIKAGLVRGAEVRALTVAPTGPGSEVPTRLLQLADEVLAGQEIAAIGLCLKGIVDPVRGVLLDVDEVLGCWIGQPLAEIVGEALGYRCVIENDARMYALGEFLHGAGKNCRNMVCLTLGTGVGSGVVLGGRVPRGERGTLGILGGHVTVKVDGPRCACGNTGCLQALIGTPALAATARDLLAAGHSSLLRESDLSPAAIFRAARAGDGPAREVVERFSQYLGAGIVTLVHAYDPDVVVLGGGISRAWPQFLPAVQAYVDAHAWTIPRARVRVLPSAAGDASALIGVAALAGAADLVP